MNTEIRYIIENKKFKQTWGDYFIYAGFLFPLIIFTVGLIFLIQGTELKDYFIGTLLTAVAFPWTGLMLIRVRQLNQFEEIINTRSKELNFELSLQGLKVMRVVETHRDGL